MTIKALIAWSSGKDSAWTLHVLRSRHGLEPAALLTIVSEVYDRVSMHAAAIAPSTSARPSDSAAVCCSPVAGPV